MSGLSIHLKYLRYVIRHKWFVFQAGLKTGAPIWRLIVHDWSKFLPCEWIPYARFFYGDFPDAAVTGRFVVDFGHNPRDFKDVVAAEFDEAWLHHQHMSPHHWQHWLLREDSGNTKALQMPEHFVREMVADWAGAGKAITGRWEVAEWYGKNKDKMVLHERTRDYVEGLLLTHFAAEEKP